MEQTYTFQNKKVLEVWKSFNGSYWVITDEPEEEDVKYGFACSNGSSGGDWDNFDASILDRKDVWKVYKENWPHIDSKEINIVRSV